MHSRREVKTLVASIILMCRNLRYAKQPRQPTRVQKSEMSKPKIKGKARPETSYSIFCCQGGDCTKAGAKEILKQLKSEVRDSGLKPYTHIVKTECAGLCKCGPVIAVFTEQEKGVQPLVWYGKVSIRDIGRIVKEHLKDGEVVEDKLLNAE